MSNAMIRKESAFGIINHWFLAASFFVLTISGFGFLFHLEQIGSLFGGFTQMKAVHNWAGVVFGISLFLTIFHYLPVSLRFGADEIGWLMVAGGYLSRKVTVPPQDELNAGQKLYYLLLFFAGIAIAASGFVIWLRPSAADINRWVLLSHLIHNISFDLLVMAIPAHIYLGTLANPGTLQIMITGMVPLEWAREHYPKWVRKMGY
jgi:formate dehydrogenase subunit gamma